MNLLKIFQALQHTHETHHMIFFFRDDLYLVHDIGDQSENEDIIDLNTAFVSGTSASGGTILVNNNQLLECQFHMMTVIDNHDGSIITNFKGVDLDTK